MQVNGGFAVLLLMLACWMAPPSLGAEAQVVPPEVRQPEGSAEASAPSAADSEASIPTLAAHYSALIAVEPPRLAELVRAGLEVHPELTRDALLMVVGRPIPAGIPIARTRARGALKDAARASLGFRLLDEEQGPAWREHMGMRLAAPETPAYLWEATANAAASRRLFGLEARIAEGLGKERPQRVRAAAIRALRELFLVELTTTEQYETFTRQDSYSEFRRDMTNFEVGNLALRAARLLDTKVLETSAALYAAAPDAARKALLDKDPRRRVLAAHAIEEQRMLSGLEPDDLHALLQGVKNEEDPQAFSVMLDTISLALERQAFDHPDVVDLRDALASVGRRLTGPLVEGALAKAYGRLAWGDSEQPLDSNLRLGFDRVAGLAVSVIEGEEPLDPDASVQVFDALGQLCRKSEEAGVDPVDAAKRARGALLAFLADESRPQDLRRAATRPACCIGGLPASGTLLELFDSPNLPAGMAYELLSGLAEIATKAAEQEPLPTEAQDILGALVKLAGRGDGAVSQEALSLLIRGELAPIAADELTDHVVDLLALDGQSGAPFEIQDALLEWLATYGDFELLAPILTSERFDALIQGTDPARLRKVTDCLAGLAGGDALRIMAVAERLDQVDDSGSEVARLEASLSLVSHMDAEAVSQLKPASHCRIVEWATDLQVKNGVSFSANGELAFLGRLVDVHLPRCTPGELSNQAFSKALFLGELSRLEEREIEPEEVYGLYQEALKVEALGPDEVQLILRTQARYASAVSDKDQALTSYRRALELEPGEAESRPSALELFDLRAMARLLWETPTPERASTSCEVLRLALGREAWMRENATVRLDYLRLLGDCALLADDKQHLVWLRAGLFGLPTEPLRPPANTVGSLWDGLVSDADSLGSLRALASRIQEPATTDPTSTDTKQAEKSQSAGDSKKPLEKDLIPLPPRR